MGRRKKEPREKLIKLIDGYIHHHIKDIQLLIKMKEYVNKMSNEEIDSMRGNFIFNEILFSFEDGTCKIKAANDMMEYITNGGKMK